MKDSSKPETFNSNATEFVPLGEQRYGLRGDKLKTSSIARLYRKPERQVTLNHGGGEMWLSDYSPSDEGIQNCKQIKCPAHHGGYDKQDTCWVCDSGCPQKMVIPYIHPHVKN